MLEVIPVGFWKRMKFLYLNVTRGEFAGEVFTFIPHSGHPLNMFRGQKRKFDKNKVYIQIDVIQL